MFGRLQTEEDGRRVFRDTDPLPLESPRSSTGPDWSMRSQLSAVVGLLASLIDGVAPFIGDEQEVNETTN
ncbi:hypothetical protein OH76DRAFT_1203359 [Lentinus brumalis]|uniref:Uncharacterized protein n=1 Tax=Lentinus brumalis TaxID=2498619 RepID=A0A371CSZ1_9APHY|nr:hypothetical protein OH76DRAFT_1203359 [Polyporus brumalis]